jgi:hypothetical protein
MVSVSAIKRERERKKDGWPMMMFPREVPRLSIIRADQHLPVCRMLAPSRWTNQVVCLSLYLVYLSKNPSDSASADS